MFWRLLCVRELRCNNCNLEFKGFALPGALKVTAEVKEEPGVKRRRAPRYKASLPAQVSLTEVDRASSGVRYSQEIQGHTREISAMGLSVVLRDVDGLVQRLDGSGRRLRIRLVLPAGPIYLHIAPVYREQLDEKKPQAGWVIAGPITKMEGADRARLVAYLGTLK
ncbi:MAG TPA: hypothetical protein VGO91_12895 [Pyrinomonadaceae bacterium]|jgi:hypothetical protein|nr:hypothetical protein [Pyrinomonadaceae bacterium]